MQTLQESASNVRAAVYAVCMIHGLLVSRQMFGPVGLTKIYALSNSQVHHGIDVILKSKFREQNRPSELQELGELLTKVSQTFQYNISSLLLTILCLLFSFVPKLYSVLKFNIKY